MSATEREGHLCQIFMDAAGVLESVMEGQSLSACLEQYRAEYDLSLFAAVSHLCYGVLREFGSLEAIVGQLAKNPPESPGLLSLLLMACYRLRTRPKLAYATIDQAVEAARRMHLPTGFVNGLLRNYLRQSEVIDQKILASPEAKVRWNFPAWWLSLLQKHYPDNWESVVMACNDHPPMTLRVNQRETTQQAYLDRLFDAGIQAEPIDSIGIRLELPVSVSELPGFFEGQVSVQDASAQKAAMLLAVQQGDHVLDACCAPGGKTGHLLESADISLVALDVDRNRIEKVTSNLERLGLFDENRVVLKVHDCLDTEAWFDGRQFDKILLDAPCSGSGVVRRHPDAKWLKAPNDIIALQKIQRDMLHALWATLKPGGFLLYATCSLFEAENQQQIDRFLVDQPEARVCPIDGKAFMQILPDDHYDGFFYALLQRQLIN